MYVVLRETNQAAALSSEHILRNPINNRRKDSCALVGKHAVGVTCDLMGYLLFGITMNVIQLPLRSRTLCAALVPPDFFCAVIQACYDAAGALSAHGGGVQLSRCECFTHGCRAVFPGDGVVEGWMETAFSG